MKQVTFGVFDTGRGQENNFVYINQWETTKLNEGKSINRLIFVIKSATCKNVQIPL